MTSKNGITIDGNGNMVIKGADNLNISIDLSNGQDILTKLNQLEDGQLDVLAQISDQDKDILSELFVTLLNGKISEKNIVKGSISNIKGDVVIGDNNTRIYQYYTIQEKHHLRKDLTLKIPKLREDQIIGREKDLLDLHTRLFNQKQVVVVNGMGGIGKTTLAQVYLSKYYESYQHVAWIELDSNSETIVSDFISNEGLLKSLNISEEGKTPIQLFKEIISAFKEIKEIPGLLILDNATKQLAEYYDYLPSQPNWHVLATSRQNIPHFDLKELDFLNQAESIALFKKNYTLSKLDDTFLEDLVGELEYHTLTIEILAKTAQEQRIAPEKLKLAIQNNLSTDIETRHSKGKVEKITSYLCSIFKTSKLDALEQKVLQNFICLPNEFQTFDILNDLLVAKEEQKSALSKTLNSLSRKGWLLYNQDSDSYKIHRIIMDVVRITLGLEEADIKLLLENVSNRLSIDQAKDNPIDKFKWVPFGKAILYDFAEATTKKITKLQNNLALVLQDLGDYQGAKNLLEKSINSSEKKFGEEHSNTAICYSNLALVLQDLGDFQGAKYLLEKAISSDEKNFGEEHPSTARCYSNLAIVLRDLGDYQGAKVLLEKAMSSLEKNFGEEHPSTSICYSNLAIVLIALREYQGAKAFLEKAVRSDEKNFGEEHPSTARCYSNLAMVLKDLEDYQGAKELLEKAMRSDEKNFGKEHPITAIRYSNLALVLKELGDYQGAKELLEKAIGYGEEIFGKEHPTIAIRYTNLASVLIALGDHQGAKKLFKKAYNIFKTKFGVEHPNTKTVKEWLDDMP